MTRLLIAFLLLSTAAVAEPGEKPWAIVATDASLAPVANLRPVVISRIDGVASTGREAVVAPGPHLVTVDLPPREGLRLGAQANLELQANACMRYYLAAKRDASGQGWQPVVRAAESIGECLVKFKGGLNAQ
jgi:hypothetical protein